MKSIKYTSSKDIIAYRTNPWMGEIAGLQLAGKAVGFSSTKFTLLNFDTGEIAGDTSIVARKRVDKEEFVKLFQPGINSILLLRRPATDLLMFVLKILVQTNTNRFSSDQIYLNYRALCADHGYAKSQSVFITARNELCIHEFIAAAEDRNNIFFINPTKLFKGDRLKLNF